MNECVTLPLNCASHSLTDSISIEFRSLRSSYSLSDEVTENVARPLDASFPPNAAYGPPKNNIILLCIAHLLL